MNVGMHLWTEISELSQLSIIEFAASVRDSESPPQRQLRDAFGWSSIHHIMGTILNQVNSDGKMGVVTMQKLVSGAWQRAWSQSIL
jgi:hypothetical protein